MISAYADRIIPIGEIGSRHEHETRGNFMVASLVELIGQVMVFAEARGVDPAISRA